MNDYTKGRVSALRDMIRDRQSQVSRATMEAILSECLDETVPAVDAGEIKNFVTNLLDNGVTADYVVNYACKHFRITHKEFARIVGTSAATLSRAVHGDVRQALVGALNNFAKKKEEE